jgi:hypothetical protein
MDSAKIFQVGGDFEHPPIGPLYLRERARVRAAIPSQTQQPDTPNSPLVEPQQ